MAVCSTPGREGKVEVEVEVEVEVMLYGKCI